MDRKTIKYFLDLQDMTYEAVGKLCDPPVKRSAVCQTIAGQLKSRKIQEAVAKALHRPIESIFPDGKKEHT